MKSSDQHHYACLSMLTWDKDGLLKDLCYIEKHNPCSMCFLCKYLDTIANATAVSSFVNADNTQAVGEAILHIMEGKTMTDIFFSRKRQVHNITSDSNNSRH